MLGAVIAWASGLFGSVNGGESAAPKQKTLWALVDWNDYTENQPILLKANRSEIDVTTAAKRDYFSMVGVPAARWTYSIEKPTDEPAGHRWIPLEAGFGLKVRI